MVRTEGDFFFFFNLVTGPRRSLSRERAWRLQSCQWDSMYRFWVPGFKFRISGGRASFNTIFFAGKTSLCDFIHCSSPGAELKTFQAKFATCGGLRFPTHPFHFSRLCNTLNPDGGSGDREAATRPQLSQWVRWIPSRRKRPRASLALSPSIGLTSGEYSCRRLPTHNPQP